MYFIPVAVHIGILFFIQTFVVIYIVLYTSAILALAKTNDFMKLYFVSYIHVKRNMIVLFTEFVNFVQKIIN